MKAKKHNSWGKINWLVARVSAVIISAFFILTSVFWLSSDNLNYYQWQLFFLDEKMAALAILTLLSIVVHAWIGVWTVLTDYVKNKRLRLLLECLFVLFLSVCLFWGVVLLGG